MALLNTEHWDPRVRAMWRRIAAEKAARLIKAETVSRVTKPAATAPKPKPVTAPARARRSIAPPAPARSGAGPAPSFTHLAPYVDRDDQEAPPPARLAPSRPPRVPDAEQVLFVADPKRLARQILNAAERSRRPIEVTPLVPGSLAYKIVQAGKRRRGEIE
jgi:hypothetical protein